MPRLFDYLFVSAAGLWLVTNAYVLTAVASGLATLLSILALAILATWTASRLPMLIKPKLKLKDVQWLDLFHRRLWIPSVCASVALICLSMDVLFARLGADQWQFNATRVMCASQSSAPTRMTIERISIDGEGCFTSDAQPSVVLRVKLDASDRHISIGQTSNMVTLSGASLVFGKDAYVFAAKIQ